MDNMKEQAAQQQERKAGGLEKRADKMAKKHLRGGRRGRKAEARATAAYRKADRTRSDPTPGESWQELKASTAALFGKKSANGSAVAGADATPDPTRPIGAEPVAPVEPVRAAPAQWAPDPWGEHKLRWWDGAQWTVDTAD